MGNNQAINWVRVESCKTRNRGTFSGSLAALIGMGSLQVEETSAYCTVNHRASASNYQLSNMEAPSPRFEPAASEVGGENSNRYNTEPP